MSPIAGTERREGEAVRAGRTLPLALAAAAVGAAGTVGAWLLDPLPALHAYLVAFAYGISLPLGALCLVMIGHVTAARWLVVVRRPAEVMAATLPLFAVLFLPILLGMDTLYPWAGPTGTLPLRLQEAIAKKDGWLNATFFTVRSALYLGVWIGLASALWRWSVADDARDREAPRAGRPVALSAAGLILFGLTFTFASFDWLMSLEPDWASTAYGLYFFAGSFLGALALLAVLACALERSGHLAGRVAASHTHALGRLLLTFVVFWAYIAFAQGFIVWIADVPREARWYVNRWEDGWAWVLGALVLGHFVAPFLLLLSRPLKRRAGVLAAVGAWLLAMHWVDVYWLVIPALPGEGPWPGWEQIPALLLVLGSAVAFGAARFAGHAAAPVGDPLYPAGLEYESR